MGLLRVISWNMAYMKPGTFRSLANRRRQWAFLAALDPDIALLQEAQPGDLTRLAPAHMANDFVVIGTPRGPRVGGSLILVRKPFAVREIDAPHKLAAEAHLWEMLRGYVTCAQLTIDGVETLLASVHALAGVPRSEAARVEDHERFRRPSREWASFNDIAAGLLQSIAGESVIVGGDWNLARLFDETSPHGAPGAAEFFAGREAAGWRDSLRKFHPDEVRTYLQPGSSPYELDHVFTDAALNQSMTRADVLAGPPADELSDHAPVIVEVRG